MRSISVEMSDEDFRLLNGMAKQSNESRSSVLCDALRIKKALIAREHAAVMDGLKSAKDAPLISDEDAQNHFEAFKRSVHGE